ncbi:MAG: ethanolamine ammonia-lyase subunit EutC [Bosea sp. (in: a-proteobacteria)]
MSEDRPVVLAPARLSALTSARVGLGRTGASLPTRELLRFGLAHAQARDAVHEPFRPDQVVAELAAIGLDSVCVDSAAPTREIYLRRPDLGRRLSPDGRAALAALQVPCDLAIVVADGLSATAVHRHATGLIAALLPLLRGLSHGTVVIASQGRVALGDEIGALMPARLVLVLIGERPGLSSPDSLGAYLTFAPRPGLTDEARNCVSNIRPEGLSPALAAARLGWLIAEALRRGLSGVALKDDSGPAQLAGQNAPPGIG